MSEWNERELCPDGGCTGVIGDDGTCKVCGKQGLAPRIAAPAKDHDDDSEDSEDDADEDQHEHEQPSDTREWGERELCSDGACVGVLDDAGACKVCGKQSPTWKPPVVRAPAPAEDTALGAAAADLAASIPAEAVEAVAPAPSPFVDDSHDDEPRALCPDGACVGVIGKDGKCRLCGKEAA
jgi:hypothetical protein